MESMKSVEYTVSSIAHDFGNVVRSTTTILMVSLIFHDSWLHRSLMTSLVNQGCKWSSSFSGTQASSQIFSFVSVLHRIMAWFSLQFTSKCMCTLSIKEKAKKTAKTNEYGNHPETESPHDSRAVSLYNLLVWPS